MQISLVESKVELEAREFTSILKENKQESQVYLYNM